MSGLLCSYGCRQVVICGQLALYCHGKTASFSARVVSIDNDKGSSKCYIHMYYLCKSVAVNRI